MKKQTNENGFTLVELIVIIAVSAIFFLSAIQLSLSISQMSADGSQRAIASNIAYKNLRKFANGSKPLFYDCALYGGAEYPMALDPTPNINSMLPGATVNEVVLVSAPYGCGGDPTVSGMPIRVQSQVTYGPDSNRKTITHATYATY